MNEKSGSEVSPVRTAPEPPDPGARPRQATEALVARASRLSRELLDLLDELGATLPAAFVQQAMETLPRA